MTNSFSERQNLSLNRRAHEISEAIAGDADRLRIWVHDDGVHVPLIDCGVNAPGSLAAGLRVAEVCLAGEARVELVPWIIEGASEIGLQVWTDQPVIACLASQYAGWKLEHDDFFAMGSGPMRALATKEPLFNDIAWQESSNVAVGVLEADELPPPELGQSIADACDVEHRKLTLLVARTASIVGTMQILARSVETAMHKLYAMDFDIDRIMSGYGVAPLPPLGGDNLLAMGRTNDAILYGASVSLWAVGDDRSLEAAARQLPSVSSPDYGRSFQELFDAYDRDFYQMDPMLFSPAHVVLHSLQSGRRFSTGGLNVDVLRSSFCED